jgi:putative cell wall-binding protein
VPATVRNELLRLSPNRVTILGGMGAVSESIRGQINDLLNP